ncbi:MAG TPA: hypothetical protein VJN18_32965 [Polyangiaceae bacterium]|nr:hypothetical protein [Polyangiaceae bacterium]
MRRAAQLALLLALACNQQKSRGNHTRSEAVSSTSQEMSGPSLFSAGLLTPAFNALRGKADGKWLRVEIRPREIVLQAEDSSNPGSVLEYHYRDGKVGEAEQATLRGKGQLADNVFDISEVKLEAIPALTREALRRVDLEHGSVELVLVRRNLPESQEVRLRVYVSSPRFSGYVEADRAGQPL